LSLNILSQVSLCNKVDDCSPDQAALNVVKGRWPMVSWLSTPQNLGAGAARNVGLRQAQGERLVFADSDDEFLPEAFEFFDEHVDDDDQLVYFLAEAVQEADGSPSNRADDYNDLCKSYLENPSPLTLERLKHRHLVPWAKVYSRQFIMSREITFEESRVSNDIAFNVLAAVQAQKVGVAPVAVYRAHRRLESLTANPSPDVFLERVAVKARLATALKELGIKEGRSATGHMLDSCSYGPRAVIRTCYLCLRSDMRIDVLQLFQLDRWARFLKKHRTDRAEKRAALSSRPKR
jgi:glycosyltransferase involved in cell wall biosynthesis